MDAGLELRLAAIERALRLLRLPLRPLLSTAEVAELLGVSMPYVRRLAARGELAALRLEREGKPPLLRFRCEAVEEYIARKEKPLSIAKGSTKILKIPNIPV